MVYLLFCISVTLPNECNAIHSVAPSYILLVFRVTHPFPSRYFWKNAHLFLCIGKETRKEGRGWKTACPLTGMMCFPNQLVWQSWLSYFTGNTTPVSKGDTQECWFLSLWGGKKKQFKNICRHFSCFLFLSRWPVRLHWTGLSGSAEILASSWAISVHHNIALILSSQQCTWIFFPSWKKWRFLFRLV